MNKSNLALLVVRFSISFIAFSSSPAVLAQGLSGIDAGGFGGFAALNPYANGGAAAAAGFGTPAYGFGGPPHPGYGAGNLGGPNGTGFGGASFGGPDGPGFGGPGFPGPQSFAGPNGFGGAGGFGGPVGPRFAGLGGAGLAGYGGAAPAFYGGTSPYSVPLGSDYGRVSGMGKSVGGGYGLIGGSTLMESLYGNDVAPRRHGYVPRFYRNMSSGSGTGNGSGAEMGGGGYPSDINQGSFFP